VCRNPHPFYLADRIDGNPDQAPAGQSNNDKTIEQIKANGRSNERVTTNPTAEWIARQISEAFPLERGSTLPDP
jgi:hypothetical protein